MWVVVAAGIAVGLSVAFWQRILGWANETLAGWLGELFGEELREAFRMLLAAGDRFAVLAQRSASLLAERIVRVRLLFRRNGQTHEKVVVADLRNAEGEMVHMQRAEVVPWHELPDEVREAFIRRQTTNVEIELKLEQ
jgi:hypothetical protein